jgi:copper oxidase (laccase) domain-containing protein
MITASPLLAAIPGLRHAFFSREGGVSDGIYAGLNGGLGSNDDPVNVMENRRRMAEAMGVAPTHFLSLHQIHSPDVVVATGPWSVRAPMPSSPARKGLRSASPRPIAGRYCSSIPTPA